MQYLVYDPNFDPQKAAPPSPSVMEALGKFTNDAIRSGILVATGGLPPTGTRLTLKEGQFIVTDGPFIELKELMGGWAILRAADLNEAIEWCKKFRQIIGDGESEIVPIYGPEV